MIFQDAENLGQNQWKAEVEIYVLSPLPNPISVFLAMESRVEKYCTIFAIIITFFVGLKL